MVKIIDISKKFIRKNKWGEETPHRKVVFEVDGDIREVIFEDTYHVADILFLNLPSDTKVPMEEGRFAGINTDCSNIVIRNDFENKKSYGRYLDSVCGNFYAERLSGLGFQCGTKEF